MKSATQKQSAPSQRCVKMQADKQGGIDFTPKTGKDTGYMKEDSAGQENIFAVEAKPFLTGSSKDTAVSRGTNAAVAAVAVAVGAAVIVGGILFTKNSSPEDVPNVLDELPTESLSSISQRLVPKAVREAVQEAPAKVQDAVESAAALAE